MAGKSKVPGGNMHETGAVKLDPSKETGVNVLPDGKVALSEQVVKGLVDAYAKRKKSKK